jgi:hypothetical protein
MPNVYGVVIWGSCLASIILPIALFTFALRQPRIAHFARISWLILLILLCSILSCAINLTITEEVQARIALPYIQNALNEQCRNVTVVADTSGFVIDPGFKWKSQTENVVCYPGSSGWRCDCNSQ